MFDDLAPEVLEAAGKVKAVIFDVDGVLTDGRIILDNTQGENKNEYKAFHVRDGHGIKMLVREGIRVALITGRSSAVVKRRAAELGIDESDIYQGSKKKIEAYEKVKKQFNVIDDEVAFVGDDIVDLPVMIRVGFPVAVADAWEELFRHAKYRTRARAGRGAVREITDLILKAKGRLDAIIETYTQD